VICYEGVSICGCLLEHHAVKTCGDGGIAPHILAVTALLPVHIKYGGIGVGPRVCLDVLVKMEVLACAGSCTPDSPVIEP
jgi:hypothetical protein